MFAARSAAPSPEESLEPLDAAPPRGIHHHYARLAMITLPGAVTDCRPGWPEPEAGESCACQICVTPERHNDEALTLQDAVNQLARGGGGTITLCPGVYNLDEPLRVVDTSSIRIRGCGANSELHCGDTAIIIAASEDIVLDDFAVTAHAGRAAVVLDEKTQSCRLSRLRVTAVEGAAIAMSGMHRQTEIHDCLITARTDGVTGVQSGPLFTQGLTIRDNRLQCEEKAIDLGIDREAVVYDGTTLIAGNTITGCTQLAVRATGLVAPPGDRLQRTLEICGNTIEAEGTAIVTGPNVRITDNTITATQRAAQQHGIVVEASPPDTRGDAVHVLANIVSGVTGDAIRVTAPIRSLTLADNTVYGAGGGIAVTVQGLNTTAEISNNTIRDLKPTPQEVLIAVAAAPPDPLVCGIIVTGATTATINGNTVDGVAADPEDSALDLRRNRGARLRKGTGRRQRRVPGGKRRPRSQRLRHRRRRLAHHRSLSPTTTYSAASARTQPSATGSRCGSTATTIP